MSELKRAVRKCLVALACAAGVSGCDSGCDEETIYRAVAFVDAHQTCQINADCVVVNDYCGELPGGWCGQLPMNRSGAESAEWRRIELELEDCAPDECAVCSAQLIPTCTNGFCRPP